MSSMASPVVIMLAEQRTAPGGDARDASVGGVFAAAVPFMISSGAFAFKLFCDRIMLAWHSERAMIAALSAGMSAFMLASLFTGTAGYVASLVAQYNGAGRPEKIGASVWQSIFFGVAAGLFVAVAGLALAPAFGWIGHEPALAGEESIYFSLLTSGSVVSLVNISLMCFWIGRKKTWSAVGINAIAIFVNILLDWLLIFGRNGVPNLERLSPPLAWAGGFLNALAAGLDIPAMGIAGAGVAGLAADCLKAGILFFLFLRPANRERYGTFSGCAYDSGIARNFLRFGMGNGMQLLLTIGAFSVFNAIIGKYAVATDGVNVATASGIAFSVNSLAFIPMLGLGTAAAMLVGHGVGAGDVAYARRVVGSARMLAIGYIAVVFALFTAFPGPIVRLFNQAGALDARTRELAAVFLWFAAVFFVADSLSLLYGSVIRGAGDTAYAMKIMAVTGWGVCALPCLAAFHLGAGAATLWCIVIVYAFSTAAAYYQRYRQGKWQTMRII